MRVKNACVGPSGPVDVFGIDSGGLRHWQWMCRASGPESHLRSICVLGVMHVVLKIALWSWPDVAVMPQFFDTILLDSLLRFRPGGLAHPLPGP